MQGGIAAGDRGDTARGAVFATVRSLFSTPYAFFVVLALFLGAHAFIRLSSLSIPTLDESWQLVLAQKLAWGYYAQPPLYTWLQIAFFKIFGESLFALAALKHALLFALYAFTYASARIVARRHADAMFAALCLLLIPQIAWESHRDLTHSVLLSATTASTLCAFLWLAEAPTILRAVACGVSAGLLLLSKYNAAAFLLGALMAVLIVRLFRKVLLSRYGIVAAISCLIVAAPHSIWAIQNTEDAFATVQKLGFRGYETWVEAAMHVPLRVASGVLPNLLVLAGLYLIARRRQLFTFRNDAARLVFWTWVSSVVVVAIAMMVLKAAGMRGRWFQPIFICAPVLFVAQLEEIPRWLFRSVAVAAAVVVVTTMVLLPINMSRPGGRKLDLSATTFRDVCERAEPQIRSAELIVTDNFWLGGAARHAFGKPVAMLDAMWPLQRDPQSMVVMFNARRGNEPAAALRDFIADHLGRDVRFRVLYISDPNMHPGMRVGVAEVF